MAVALMAVILFFSACNKKSETTELKDTGTLAVSAFSLKRDANNVGLDSVYFAIDLNRRVIYNADSLRPDTDITGLIPVITYSGGVDKATIIMEGGSKRTGEVNYKTNPTDSIDFTGKVTFTLTQGDKSISYLIKVNVHKEYADSLVWNEADRMELPSRLPDPLRQKTVLLSDSTSVCLLLESDGSYTVATTSDLYYTAWTKSQENLPFVPEVSSLTAVDDTLYILDDAGNLFHRTLATSWEPTGVVWHTLIGGYINSVVGLRADGGNYYFDKYPAPEAGDSFNPCQIPDDFPVTGTSNFVTLQNKWTLSPVAFLTGGITADGSFSSATWAFDGAEWVCLNKSNLPALRGSSIVPYYYFRRNTSTSELVEYNVWMLIGGRDINGLANRIVYISYDNGVNWIKASSQMQLPQVIPAMSGCDNIVVNIPKKADIADNWTRAYTGQATRSGYTIDGTTISWQCPYIYLIGGYSYDDRLYNTIWRGVLTRLTFVPVF